MHKNFLTSCRLSVLKNKQFISEQKHLWPHARDVQSLLLSLLLVSAWIEINPKFASSSNLFQLSETIKNLGVSRLKNNLTRNIFNEKIFQLRLICFLTAFAFFTTVISVQAILPNVDQNLSSLSVVCLIKRL